MSDENDLEINTESNKDNPVIEDTLLVEETYPLEGDAVTRAGVGLKTALLLSVLAALTGAFGGAALSQVFSSKSPAGDNVQSQITRFTEEKNSLSRDVSQLKQTVKTLKVQKPDDVSAFKARLEKLENQADLAPVEGGEMALADITARIDALETSLETNKDMQSTSTASSGNAMPQDILKRLKALETKAPMTDMNEFVDRLDRLEVQSLEQPQKQKIAKVTAAPVPIEKILIPPFPRASVLKAASSSEQGGWLNRTLDKHVKIREAGEASPKNIADQIQAHLDAGEYAEAIAVFDTLPSKARSVGKAWRDAVAADIKANP